MAAVENALVDAFTPVRFPAAAGHAELPTRKRDAVIGAGDAA